MSSAFLHAVEMAAGFESCTLVKTLLNSIHFGMLNSSAARRTVSPRHTTSTAFVVLTSSQFLYFLQRNTQELSLSVPCHGWMEQSFSILLASGISGPVTPLAAILLLHSMRKSWASGCTRDRKLMTCDYTEGIKYSLNTSEEAVRSQRPAWGCIHNCAATVKNVHDHYYH